MKWLNWLDYPLNIMKYLAGALILFGMCSVCYEVVMRYVFERPTSWVLETNEYVLFIICFLSLAWVLKVEGHVRMDAVLGMLSPRKQHILNIFACVVGIFYCGVLFYWGIDWAWDSFQRGSHFSNFTQWPVASMAVMIPFGSFFLILELVRKIVGYVNALLSRLEDQQ